MTTIEKMTKPTHILILVVAILLAACGPAASSTTVEPEPRVLASPTPQPTPPPTIEIPAGDESQPAATPTEEPVEITQNSPVATPPEEITKVSPIVPLATPSPADSISREENRPQGGGAIPDSVAIIFHRSGGFAGITEQWTFYLDGRIEASGGEQRQVEPEKVQALLETIRNAGFFDLSDSYIPQNTCCDRFTYAVTVHLDGETKSVATIDASPTQPEELTTVLSAIAELLMASQ